MTKTTTRVQFVVSVNGKTRCVCRSRFWAVVRSFTVRGHSRVSEMRS